MSARILYLSLIHIFSQERSYGSFARSFDISAVDEEHITASYENGVLKLVLPKKEQTKPSGGRRLEIN